VLYIKSREGKEGKEGKALHPMKIKKNNNN